MDYKDSCILWLSFKLIFESECIVNSAAINEMVFEF